MAEITLSLLSGLIGAIIASIIAIGYTEFKEKRERRISLARAKLEKVYGPLIALRKKIDQVSVSGGGFLQSSNPVEANMIENIIYHQYHLIDDDLKEDIFLLHPQLNADTNKQIIKLQNKVEEKIIEHYNENKKILGLR